jgi:hypothetical protein
VIASASHPYTATPGGPHSSGSFDAPTLATGRINGLGGAGNIPMELQLRPQPNDFLHGELVIHEAGYGSTPIQGFICSDHVEFQAPYGAKTLYFQGQAQRRPAQWHVLGHAERRTRDLERRNQLTSG